MATECYLRLRKFDNATTYADLAVKHAEVAAKSQPAFPGPQAFLANSREKLARCYYDAGRYEDAVNLLTVVIESFETGLGGYERQRLDGAIESEKEAKEENELIKRKRMARLFFQMSMAHWKLENKDVALGFFEKAVANVDTDFPSKIRDELETKASALLGVEPSNRKPNYQSTNEPSNQ